MTEIDFFFDIFSPYAYLAFHRLNKIADEYGCKVNYRPIDLVRAKKAAGNTGPPNVAIPPKIRYLMVDLKRWASKYKLPFAMPKLADTSRINKGVLFAKARNRETDYIRQAYAAVWGRGADPSNDETLSALAREMGWDEKEFFDFIVSEKAGKAYEAIFEDAVARGVFGVPIVIIGDEMWWGNDRLFLVEELLKKERRKAKRKTSAAAA